MLLLTRFYSRFEESEEAGMPGEAGEAGEAVGVALSGRPPRLATA